MPAHGVRVSIGGDGLELRFGWGFDAGDLEIVKSIRGRRWAPDRTAWQLPHSADVIDTLRTAFGPRLILPELDREAVTTNTGQETPVASLADTMRRAIRVRGYSRKTELAYVSWVRRFVEFSGEVASTEQLHSSHAHAFLVHLTQRRLAAKSRNQAASALSFMFREVLGRDEMADVARAKGPSRMPVVLSHREVLRVLGQLTGRYFLIAVLLYSAGLRLQECLRLRVKDVDFDLRQILVRDGKGRKDRYVPLARRAAELLRAQIRRVLELHASDRARGNGWAQLPDAIQHKDPAAAQSPAWQWLFPAREVRVDPPADRVGRAPLHPTAVQRQMKQAVQRSGITKRASCHTLRHSFATEALRGGCDIRMLQHVMGHRDIRTTTIYLHVVEQTGLHMRSPLDRPDDPDDLDLDQVGRPWPQPDQHWDLAARQWPAPRKRRGGAQERRPPAPPEP